MSAFFEKNKIFLAIIIAGLLIAGAMWLSNNKTSPEPANLGADKTAANQPVDQAGGDCSAVPDLPDNSAKLVTKVIDGDTFIIEGGYSVRLLGIDSDERGYPCYDAAKNKLEELVLNKAVKLERESEDLDQYCRYLRYVLLDEQNINLIMVKEGLAVARFYPENIKYRAEIESAGQTAKNNKTGCKWSGVGATANDSVSAADLQWSKLTAGKIVGACQAGNYYEQEMIIEGKVADTNRSKTNTIFLNLEKPYPNHCFTAVIFSSDLYKFVAQPEDYYLNKIVRVKGKIQEYQGKPEIILSEPEQIEAGG